MRKVYRLLHIVSGKLSQYYWTCEKEKVQKYIQVYFSTKQISLCFLNSTNYFALVEDNNWMLHTNNKFTSVCLEEFEIIEVEEEHG